MGLDMKTRKKICARIFKRYQKAAKRLPEEKNRGGRVFVKIVENCSKEELAPIIQGKILEKSVVYTDGWKGYDGLVVNGYDLKSSVPFLQRVCTGKEPCQRDREFLELREAQACEVQRLRFGQVRAAP